MSRLAVVAVLALATSGAQAVIVPYTTRAAFEAAAGPFRIVDFEDAAADTEIANNGVFDDLTFSFSGLQDGRTALEIIAAPQASVVPAQQLVLGVDTNGSTTDGQFQDGDAYTVEFGGPSTIFGIVFQTSTLPVLLQDGFFSILVDSNVYTVDIDDGFLICNNTDCAQEINGYFVGVVSDTPFTQAIVQSQERGSNVFQYFNDDIYVSAVPSPASWALLATGLGIFSWSRRRTSKAARG
jgi:hypothetical protein